VSRILAWDGVANARDLGGLPVRGGETRFGVVVRSGSIFFATETGRRALASYGVTTVVDLRTAPEREAEPPPCLDAALLHFAVDGEEVAAVRDWHSTAKAYLGMLERFQPEFGAAAGAVAAADGTAVVHCHAGRDRTGVLVALLLRLAGVEPETIAEDHALSDHDHVLAHSIARWVADAPDEAQRARRQRVADPVGGAMVEVLGQLGDARAYLIEGGARPADLDTFVLRFTR
jgi:hypothetical protein